MQVTVTLLEHFALHALLGDRGVMRFNDRDQAGHRLAARLSAYASDDAVVLGLPRGGVPVAEHVAKALGAPLDVILVRKLGVPSHPELAMGAIGEDGICTINEEVIDLAHVTPSELLEVEAKERLELERRAQSLRSHRSMIDLTGKIAIIVDDGLATGSTAIAACEVARAHGAKHVVMAVPVAPIDGASRLKRYADEFVSVETPARFDAVGLHYRNFEPVTDDEVTEILDRFRVESSDSSGSQESLGSATSWSQDILIPLGGTPLPGRLEVPEHSIGIVLFAHGSGSSRHSPRNTYVAGVLHQFGIGTLLFDLLSREEERDRANVFDIALLARRLHGATEWVRSQPRLAALPIGYFGASTGAAAALVAATLPSSNIAAIVSRGGRPDLANSRLGMVRSPTLLLVGGDDHVVITLNEAAATQLHCESKVSIIPGASHLFEEPGTLQLVAREAGEWFVAHLNAASAGPAEVRSSVQ